MKKLCEMKDCLENLVQCELTNPSKANTHELGEAVDMIKDLYEAMYYSSIVKAMEENEENTKYYRPYDKKRIRRGRDTDLEDWMYDDYGYDKDNRGRYRERELTPDMMQRDPREGKSPISRKMYMESHELHHDSSKTMKELEKYMQELTEDIMDMIREATPEEKQVLKQKIATLSTKIN